jgi:hypothetical protein
MSDLSPLEHLSNYLAGEFENRQQALDEPIWYVHLRVWQRPTPLFAEDSCTLFLEQASLAAQQPPYRQRILRLFEQGSQLWGQYYALREPQAWQGGGLQPELLRSLTPDDLQLLPTCNVSIEATPTADGYRFQATPSPNTLCSFEYQGQTRYVQLGFEVAPLAPNSPGANAQRPMAVQTELLTYDKGIDPATGQGLWGALMGPFRLIKQTDFQTDWTL